MEIVYTQNKVNFEDIYEILRLTSPNFIPPLHERVNIRDYAIKIKENAHCFEAWHNNKLIGLAACYYNNLEDRIGYLTHLSILKSYYGNGIGQQLVKQCLQYGIEHNFKSVTLEANKKNDKAIEFWENLNFEQIYENIDIVYLKTRFSGFVRE